MAQPWEMQWETPAAPPLAERPPHATASDAKPWEMEWAPSADAPPPGAIIDTRTGKAVSAESFWPVRMAKDIFKSVKSAATAPRDVYEGRLDPTSPEGIRRAADFAATFSPASPALRSGELAIPGVTHRPTEMPIATDRARAIRTAEDLGAPLPAGLASESQGIQGLTQATRQLPLVGAKIDERIGATVDKARQGVADITEELTGDLPGGVPDRSVAGANLRPSLEGVIEDNNSKMSNIYSALDHVTDTSKGVDMAATRGMLGRIGQERTRAGLNPTAGLEDIAKLVNEGGLPRATTPRTVISGPGYHIAEDVAGPPLTDFKGIQRARSGIGDAINFGKPNPGYNAGDLKRIYGALSTDMERAVRAHAREGVHPDEAAKVLKSANSAASQVIEQNKNLRSLLNIKSDERLAGSVINAAKDKTGNVRLLRQLRTQMPKQDYDQIAAVGVHELGAKDGGFSLNKFGTEWNKLSDSAKSELFPDVAHRGRLDDVAHLSSYLKDADKYRNTSNTARAGLAGGLISQAVPAALKAVTGDVKPLLGVLGTMAGGRVLASALARPVTSASIARWSQAYRNAALGPSPARQAALTLATRNMISNLEGIPGFSKQELLQRLQSPPHAAADHKNLEPERVSQ